MFWGVCLFFACLGVTPGNAAVLLLALPLGMTPRGTQGTILDAGERTQYGNMKTKCFTHSQIQIPCSNSQRTSVDGYRTNDRTNHTHNTL